MIEAHKVLMDIGFTDYEARAYCALLDESPANGYQIAKRSGVPRAKIYECIERLVARGAAVRVEASDPDIQLFAPTDPEELIAGIKDSINSACTRASETLERYNSNPQVVEVLWRVASHQDLLRRGRTLTEEAQETLHVAVWAEDFDELLDSFVGAADRGVKIALILYNPHRGIKKLQERGAGAVQHSRSKRQAIPVMGRQFVLVADRERCITGSIFSDDDVEGVFTFNRGLVTNAVDLVNHEIYLERILTEVGKPVWDVYGKNLGKLDAFDSPQ